VDQRSGGFEAAFKPDRSGGVEGVGFKFCCFYGGGLENVGEWPNMSSERVLKEGPVSPKLGRILNKEIRKLFNEG
jgi:hypothetical protein